MTRRAWVWSFALSSVLWGGIAFIILTLVEVTL